MPTRFLLAGLQYFAASSAVALAVVTLAQAGAIRFFGLIALASAAAGFALDAYALREADPHLYMVLRFRLDAVFHRARAAVVRAAACLPRTAGAPAPSTVR